MAKRSTGGRKSTGGSAAQKQREDRKGFEETVGQLERVIEELESGELSLESSLEAFEKGVGLVRRAEAILNDAEKRVEILLKGQPSSKQPELKSFSPEDSDSGS
jgi:exodeoxyribonuclease VII small subunit